MRGDGRPTKEDGMWILIGAFSFLALTASVVTFVWIATNVKITAAAPVIHTPSAASTPAHGALMLLLVPLYRMIFAG
jgi:hypothetical protein